MGDKWEMWNSRKRSARAALADGYRHVQEYLESACTPVSFGYCQAQEERPCLFICRRGGEKGSGDDTTRLERMSGKAIILGGSPSCRGKLAENVKGILRPLFSDVVKYYGEAAARSFIRPPDSYRVGGPDILYRASEARAVTAASGYEVHSRLSTWLSLVESDSPDYESVRDMYENIRRGGIIDPSDRERKYSIYRRSGKRYVVTYYSPEDEKRRECSVNQILFLHNDDGVFLLREHARKERTDKIKDSDCLYRSTLFRIVARQGGEI